MMSNAILNDKKKEEKGYMGIKRGCGDITIPVNIFRVVESKGGRHFTYVTKK
jgi:hypothetical protein